MDRFALLLSKLKEAYLPLGTRPPVTLPPEEWTEKYMLIRAEKHNAYIEKIECVLYVTVRLNRQHVRLILCSIREDLRSGCRVPDGRLLRLCI